MTENCDENGSVKGLFYQFLAGLLPQSWETSGKVVEGEHDRGVGRWQSCCYG